MLKKPPRSNLQPRTLHLPTHARYALETGYACVHVGVLHLCNVWNRVQVVDTVVFAIAIVLDGFSMFAATSSSFCCTKYVLIVANLLEHHSASAVVVTSLFIWCNSLF